jgi:hypothetical protein
MFHIEYREKREIDRQRDREKEKQRDRDMSFLCLTSPMTVGKIWQVKHK